MPIIPQDKDVEIKKHLEQETRNAEDAKREPGVATVNDHKANLGPVISQNLGEPASKEELQKRAEELNALNKD